MAPTTQTAMACRMAAPAGVPAAEVPEAELAEVPMGEVPVAAVPEAAVPEAELAACPTAVAASTLRDEQPSIALARPVRRPLVYVGLY